MERKRKNIDRTSNALTLSKPVKNIQSVSPRCFYISEDKYGELSLAIDDAEEETFTSKNRQMHEDWSSFRDLNDVNRLSDCGILGALILVINIKSSLLNFGNK